MGSGQHPDRSCHPGGEPVTLWAQTCPAGPRPSGEQGRQNADAPSWLLRACLTGQRIRSYLVVTEDPAQRRMLPPHADLEGSLWAGKIEHQVTPEELQHLNALFQEYEKRGRQLLDMEIFKCIMKQSMRSRKKNIKQIEQVFMKIDYEAVGRMQWREASFQLPAVLQGLSFGGPVLRILAAPDDTLITIREDGAIYFWSLQLKLKRRKRVFDKPIIRKSRWVTDVTIMPQYNKLILGTGNREIQLYELSNLEPYRQVGGQEAVALKLNCGYEDPDKCLLLYGDDQGCVSILLLASVGELLRGNIHSYSFEIFCFLLGIWKKLPEVENTPTINLNNLNYYDSIKAVISSSNHEPAALVLGCTLGTTNVEQKMKEIKDVGENVKARKDQAFLGLPQRRAECDQTVFCIHKGVKAFTFCKGKNLLLTGGMHRIIRVWNPYLPGKPTGMLRSHTAPVIYIHVSAEDNKIFSMSTHNTIEIWDLETNSCLFTASSKASGIRGEPGACLYLPSPRALYVATDILALLHLRLSCPHEPHSVVSHKESGVCCRDNPTFRQVVSCSEASVVKVWDFETGRLLSGFTGAHGNAGITCLTFDSSGRRLITGGRDGCLKIRSYNSGQCLHTLKHNGEQGEVCDGTYLEVNQNKCIIAVGWERRIDVYFDTPCDFHHFQKPQPHWQDDLTSSVWLIVHLLLATSSYNGEIIIRNIISGHVYCKLNSPSSSDSTEDSEGPEGSVSCLAFLKTRAANLESASASLMANGPRAPTPKGPPFCFPPPRFCHRLRLFGGARPIANFAPISWSTDKARVSSMVVTAGDACAYVGDQHGIVHVYDIEDCALSSDLDVKFWRAHISMVNRDLELIEEEVMLSSSLDHTVRLWSRDEEFIGTFGQSSPWDIFTPASCSHPRVPHEVLRDPQSMPAHPVLEGGVPAMCRGEEQDKVAEGKASAEPEKTSDPRSPGDCVLEVEEDSCGGGGFGSDRKDSDLDQV
ncbi:hypothetical protein AB1E18_009502 [Capra hircus]